MPSVNEEIVNEEKSKELLEISHHLGRYYAETHGMELDEFVKLLNGLHTLYLKSGCFCVGNYLNHLTHLEVKHYVEIIDAMKEDN